VKENQQQGKDTSKERAMQVVMPLDVEVRIGTEETVRTLLTITEGMDYRELNAGYTRKPKAAEATPKQLFQLVAYGFMNGTYSTRQLEAACRNDIRYMYILVTCQR